MGDETLEAKHFIIATRAGPIFFPSLKPHSQHMIAPRQMGKLTTVPDSITVVGGGVTGTEFVYMFNRIGAQVTWLMDQYGVLPRSDRGIVEVLVTTLTGRAVEAVDGLATESMVSEGEQVTATLQDGRTFTASYGFIAIGQWPDTKELNLEAAGVETARNSSILTDSFQQSNVAHVYAIGDAARAPMTANRAMAQGRIICGRFGCRFRWPSHVERVAF